MVIHLALKHFVDASCQAFTVRFQGDGKQFFSQFFYSLCSSVTNHLIGLEENHSSLTTSSSNLCVGTSGTLEDGCLLVVTPLISLCGATPTE